MRLFAVCLLMVACLALSPLSTSAESATKACQATDYAYAGYLTYSSARGAAVTVRALSPPEVASGHVAAWVGVGGSGFGRNGSDEWMQIGIAKFEDGPLTLYVEQASNGQPSRFSFLGEADVERAYRISVQQVVSRPGWWRAWLDGRAVSPPIYLHHTRASGGEPQVVAESWIATAEACNAFDFAFAAPRVALSPGRWSAISKDIRLRDRPFRLIDIGSGFRALSS